MQRLDTSDSSTSEGESVGAVICRLRLMSSPGFVVDLIKHDVIMFNDDIM